MYSIKDLERLSGIKAHTIRMWEQRYGILAPERSDTNIRTYSNGELKQLLNISSLNQMGYKISKIVEMQPQEMKDILLKSISSFSDTSGLVEELLISMVQSDEVYFNELFSLAVKRLEFKDLVLKLIYPLFNKVGVLWQLGSISVAQEHFISNLVRNKLINRIESLVPYTTKNKSALLFLPENEWHEIGLLISYYLLKEKGYKVYYLGQSVPLEDMHLFSKTVNPDVIVSSLVVSFSEELKKELFTQLNKRFSGIPIYFSGIQVQHVDFSPYSNIKAISSLEEFDRLL